MNRQPTDRRGFLRMGAAGMAGLTMMPGLGFGQTAGRDTIAIAATLGDSGQTLLQLMQSNPFLQKYDLEPNFLSVSDGSKIVTAILTGEADVCRGSGFGQTLAAINKGAEMRVIAGACVLVIQSMYTANPDIKSLKDLEGRTVGTGAPGALLHQMSVTLLKKHGVDVDKVSFVNVGSSANVFKAVVAGTVDAGPNLTSAPADQERFGVRIIADFWAELPDYPYQAGFASLDTIANRRDVLVRALAGFQDLYDFVQNGDSRDAYVQAAMAATGETDPGKSTFQWEFFQARKPFDIMIPQSSIDYLQNLNVEAGIQEKMLPIEAIADYSLAEEALKIRTA